MAVSEKLNYFIKGVCHPGTRIDLIKEAGINFARFDTPYPFEGDSDNVLSERYIAYKERCETLYREGIYMMGITPYPKAFLDHGIDPATPEGLQKVEEICAFLAKDCAEYVLGWQVTNEMNVFHFREPLTLREAYDFILYGLKGIRRGNPKALNGYNTEGTSPEAIGIIDYLLPYSDLMDYIGLDSYCGTWHDGEVEDIMKEIDRVHQITGLPVLLQEYGFASKGEIYTEEEVLEYLKKCGYQSREEVLADPTQLIAMAPQGVTRYALTKRKEEWAANLLGEMPHILKKWSCGSKIYRHTPEGQAAFFKELLPRVMTHPDVIGSIIYCWQDTARCRCQDENCCCETAWGMTDKNQLPKPLYEVVKKCYNEL